MIDSSIIVSSIQGMIEALSCVPYLVVGVLVWVLFYIARRMLRSALRRADAPR